MKITLVPRLSGLLAALTVLPAAYASDCTVTSVGLTPLNDLGPGLYLGQFQGGLYPNGLNIPPPAHVNAGVSVASAIEPLDVSGVPDPDGRYVLMSLGMSNTTQEFGGQPWTFMEQAGADSRVNHAELAIANGALGGQVADLWDSPTDSNYDRVRDEVLAPQGLGELQVQALWIKLADRMPTVSLPAANADAYQLLGHLGNVCRSAKIRYPNVKVVVLSSRIYAGYASISLNPEPYAYETGFAVKWLIEAQIRQMAGGPIDPIAGDMDYDTVAPFVAWGPYLWADGMTPRSDGLTWACADLEDDGTHPAPSGEEKVADRLLGFMLNSPFTRPWFRADLPCPGDLNHDGDVDVTDLARLLANYGAAAGATLAEGDLDSDGDVDLGDLAQLLTNFGTNCN
jgi:hypothetical protein